MPGRDDRTIVVIFPTSIHPPSNIPAPHTAHSFIRPSSLRDAALAKTTRCDGRKFKEVRRISSDTDVLPCVHGSAVFTRGDTQVLCAVTLGSEEDAIQARYTDADEAPRKKAFLHYDFPPYSVNETGKVFGSNRRMVGHGALAERAVLPVLPDSDAFPYTIRVTSEVTASNGSSSMASACGASLALMDAGVPIKAAVAGMSIGLFTPDEEPSFAAASPPQPQPPSSLLASLFGSEAEAGEAEKEEEEEEGGGKGKGRGRGRRESQLIVDILGLEDHYGDMDFKVREGEAQGGWVYVFTYVLLISIRVP